jgi:hypothetical protein
MVGQPDTEQALSGLCYLGIQFRRLQSDAGSDLVEDLPHRRATEAEIIAAEAVVSQTQSRMGRQLDTSGLKELLQTNPTIRDGIRLPNAASPVAIARMFAQPASAPLSKTRQMFRVRQRSGCVAGIPVSH